MSESLLLNSIGEFMITRRFAKRTIQTYIYWIKRYIIFNNKQHPSKLDNKEVEQYLTYFDKTNRACSSP
ncbi:phage integrase N-terminal SAM-like domain-containing protein [Colwellia sp. TT2012]|uniref:phage integrase N-terminal SAM-like domain-containing protein n=1 Tax=Colwellia sp. TT2012 TaxID=1720342 RepID=UPI0009EC3945